MFSVFLNFLHLKICSCRLDHWSISIYYILKAWIEYEDVAFFMFLRFYVLDQVIFCLMCAFVFLYESCFFLWNPGG